MTEMPMPIFSKDIKIDPETNIMSIEGKHYRLEYSEHGKPYMIEIDVKKFNKTVQKIMEKTKDSLDSEKLLKYCLYKMCIEDLQKIEEKLKKPRKPVLKTADGCIELRVGGIPIPIAD